MNAPADPAVPTRDRIRTAALELFGDRGYDGVSMAELAERVGVAKPSLYNYYASKEELLLDLVEEGIGQWAEFCMAPFERAASFERQLADHLRLVIDFARERPHVVAVFHHATTHVRGELAERVEAQVRATEERIRGRIHGRIEAALAAGELDAETAEDVHLFLGVFFHGLLFLQTDCPRQLPPTHARLEQLWRFLFRALSGRLPQESIRP
jgi:AcrR family transcriptional regulator